MRDHSFDVKDQFNQGALTRLQIDQAEDQLSRHIIRLDRRLKAIKLMSTQVRHTLGQRINALNTYAQQILRSADSQAQMDLIIKKTELKAQQIIVSGQLKIVANLVINRIHHSSLSDEQQSTAVNEIKTAQQFSVEDMEKATNKELIKIAFTTGVNAINGALAKYVADSQINAINQIKQLVNQARAKFNQNDSIPNNAQVLINQQLKRLKQRAINSLLMSINFVQLAKTRRHYIDQLNVIASDKHHIIKAFVSFNQFMRQIDDIIISLSLSSDDKVQIERQINLEQNKGMQTLKQSTQVGPKYLASIKYQITSTIINAVSRHYQRVIATQTLMLREDQRHDLIMQIKQTAVQIAQHPLVEPIKSNLIKALRQLRAIVQQSRALLYQGQIAQVVNQIKSRVDQLYDLSQISRDYLKSQVINFSHQLKSHQSNFGEIQQTLQQFFQAQLNFVYKLSLQRDFTSLVYQIHYSHLNTDQKQNLRQRLVTIKNDSRLNYSNQQLFIKNVLNYGLKLDCSQSKKHLKVLGQMINRHVDALTKSSLKSRFTQIQTNFERNVADSSQLKDIDHQAQQAENKMCLMGYRLKNSIHSVKSQALAKLINQTHSKVSAVLRPGLKQIVNDRLNQFFNVKLITLIDATNVKTSLDKMKRAVHGRLTSALKLVKQVYAHQFNNLARTANYQLKAYSSINYADKLNQISSHVIAQIKGAGNLSRIEAMNQRDQQKLNAFSTRIISRVDSTKARAHQQIKKLVAITKSCLNNYANLTTSNRILMISNQADANINLNVDGQAQDEVTRCQSALDHVLCRSYLRVWIKVVNNAQVNVYQLIRVPTDAKQRAIHQIKIISSRVIPDIKQLDSNKLASFIRTHQTKVRAIINRVSYLDPAKRKVRDRLIKLIKLIERDAGKYQSIRVQSHTVRAVYQLGQAIDRQLSTNDDHQLQRIYQSSRKRLITWHLKIVREAQLRRFSKAFKQAEVQMQAFKFLANQKARQTEAKLNRCYHKTMYDVKHAPTAEYCLHNEQMGERQLSQVVSQSQHYNSHKKRIYTVILAKVSHAEHQINGLQYVRDSDKQSSLQLLKQIRQIAIYQIRKATDHQQILMAEHHNYQAIQQVMNNVVSANVILAAIQSANDRIAQSHLNPQQKASALKQIHQIINNGLKAQIKPKASHKMKNSGKKSDAQVDSTHSFTRQEAPKRHPLVELINSIYHFFRWLFGKLAQAL